MTSTQQFDCIHENMKHEALDYIIAFDCTYNRNVHFWLSQKAIQLKM